MHFHLPKPLHGWREFAGEVGIIVVGVLIALGAEQVVESMNWKQRASHARDSLKTELGNHYEQAAEWRIVEPCIAAQLDRLQQRLLASGDRIDPAPVFHEEDRTYVFRAPSRPYPDSVWQGVVAEGVSSHFSDEDRLNLAIEYRQARDTDDLNKQITEAAARLNSLSEPIPLDSSARLNLLQSLDEIRDDNRWVGIVAQQLIGYIDLVRMVPAMRQVRDYVAGSGTASFCRAQHLPLRPFSEATRPPAKFF